jgi:hypoxanthine phosphoribosyltransferase
MNIKKHYYSWADVEDACVNIALQMYKDNWRPDYIVGITRGGNVPATILSNMLGIRCEALKVKLRDGEEGEECETNCWMAEDAFGYPKQEMEVEDTLDAVMAAAEDLLSLTDNYKNILIVDDINDTGATFNWIKKDWQSSCLPDDPSWDDVWGNNVRFAVLTENLSSEFGDVSYYANEVNKAEEDVWLVYPWENVGK